MASKSSDHTSHKSARETDPASPGKPAKHAQDIEGENTASAREKELLGLLEELSETLDAAQDALSENQSLSSTAHPCETQPVSDEYSGRIERPIPPPVSPIGKSTFTGTLATAFGLFFGIATLAAFWLFWNSPDSPGKIKLTADQKTIATPAAAPAPKTDRNTDPAEELAAKPGSSKHLPASTTSNPPPTMQEPVELKIELPKSPSVTIEKTPPPEPLDKKEQQQLLERGQALISAGDIAGARLAFEYAAHRGSADAMYALAQTYDVEMLAIWNVVGIEPDAKSALQWYGRAAQRGHDPADARASELEKLTGNRP